MYVSGFRYMYSSGFPHHETILVSTFLPQIYKVRTKTYRYIVHHGSILGMFLQPKPASVAHLDAPSDWRPGGRGFNPRRPASVAQLDAPSDWRTGGRGFDPRRGRQHSFVEIDHEIFSMVILSLPLIQEGQLSVSGERMCTILVNHLEDYACPVNVWLGKLTALDMTPLGWLGRKTSTQTNKKINPRRGLQHSFVEIDH